MREPKATAALVATAMNSIKAKRASCGSCDPLPATCDHVRRAKFRIDMRGQSLFYSLEPDPAMSPKFIALWLFICFGASCPQADAGEPGLPTNSSATMKTTAFSPIRRKGSICGTGSNTSRSMALDFFPSAARRANVSRLIRMNISAPTRTPIMPTSYSVIFSTSITIRRDGCAFSHNCKVLSNPAGPSCHGSPDRDAIDTHQLFVDLVGNISKDGQLTLRVGRQEMSYGGERLIAAREGPNNRRAFDEVRFLYKQGAVSVDVFFGNLVEMDNRSIR